MSALPRILCPHYLVRLLSVARPPVPSMHGQFSMPGAPQLNAFVIAFAMGRRGHVLRSALAPRLKSCANQRRFSAFEPQISPTWARAPPIGSSCTMQGMQPPTVKHDSSDDHDRYTCRRSVWHFHRPASDSIGRATSIQPGNIAISLDASPAAFMPSTIDLTVGRTDVLTFMRTHEARIGLVQLAEGRTCPCV
jgi:hypothetical protein